MTRSRYAREIAAALARWDGQLTPGMRFSTCMPDGSPIESGCEVVTPPDASGSFDAYDHERVLCSFDIRMVASVGQPGDQRRSGPMFSYPVDAFED